MIELRSGNILNAEVDALVNPVNTRGVAGKGLALAFKRAFPVQFKCWKDACSRGFVRIGRVWCDKAGDQHVVYFPTKDDWRNPSKLEYIRSGLSDLIEVVGIMGFESIAIPALGCGEGGLSWDDVRPLIEGAFQSLPQIRVLLYGPKETE